MTPYYQDEHSVIYCGDCREILPQLEPVDACITDPPFGVGFSGKKTKHTNLQGGNCYDDTEENFFAVVLPVVKQSLVCAKRGAIFSGIRRLHDYPPPRDIGGIICPNGGGMSPWGFGCYHPVLFYGSSPYIAAGQGGRPTAASMYHPGMHVTGEKNGHPCQKPLAFMRWVVRIASLHGETLLDPFMGSGTTLVAAKELGRKAIGIEISEDYCRIAVERLKQDMLPFVQSQPVLTQQGLFT